MREYLSCGFAKRIVIRSRKEDESKEKILERIGQNIKLNIYDIINDDDYIILNIKKAIFEKNIYELVKEQINKQSMCEYEKLYMEYEVKKIKDKNYEDLIALAKNHEIGIFYFKRGGEFQNDISYLDPEEKCEIYCDLIELFQTGETFFECYNEIFRYFRKCIINSSDNEIKSAMVITMAN